MDLDPMMLVKAMAVLKKLNKTGLLDGHVGVDTISTKYDEKKMTGTYTLHFKDAASLAKGRELESVLTELLLKGTG